MLSFKSQGQDIYASVKEQIMDQSIDISVDLQDSLPSDSHSVAKELANIITLTETGQITIEEARNRIWANAALKKAVVFLSETVQRKEQLLISTDNGQFGDFTAEQIASIITNFVFNLNHIKSKDYKQESTGNRTKSSWVDPITTFIRDNLIGIILFTVISGLFVNFMSDRLFRETINVVSNTWSVLPGETLYVASGGFKYEGYECGNDLENICIFLFESSSVRDVTLNDLPVRSNNDGTIQWLFRGDTQTKSADDILQEQTPGFWAQNRCGTVNCARATVLIVRDGVPEPERILARPQ